MVSGALKDSTDLASAEVEVVSRLLGGDWERLLEDPPANLPIPILDPLHGCLGLLGLRFGDVFLLFPRSSADQVLVGKRCWSETNGHLQALRSEDGPKIGDQLLGFLVLNLHQCLESGYGCLLEQIVVISCHVGSKRSSLPADHMGMGLDPLRGGKPGELAGGDVNGARCCHGGCGVGPPFF